MKKTSRRDFLKTGIVISAATAGGLTAPFSPLINFNEKSFSKHNRKDYKVFSKGNIGTLTLKNRLVRASTAEGASPDCEFSDEGIALYKALAEGGTGLILTGHITVMAEGRAERTQTCIYDDSHISSISRIAETVHKTDHTCKVVAQISHAGMATPGNPVAPSEKSWPFIKKEVHVLSTAEVENIVFHFIEAGRRAKEAGFDGVEIHCAHGYLLSSFLSPYANKRTDKYGGTLEKRVTIINEIVNGIRKNNGRDFQILLKMNCDDNIEGGITIENFPVLAEKIAGTGIDALEISGNNPIRKDLKNPESQSYFLKYAEKLKLKIPVILTGGNKSVELLEEIVQSNKVDFFGFARPLLREPGLPKRWLEGTGGEETTCISCNRCLGYLGTGAVTRCRLEG